MIVRILRSTGAVLAGFVAVVVLSMATDAVLHAVKYYPPESEGMWDPVQNAVALAYRSLFTVVGGWLTARLAPTAPMIHAGVLSVLGLAGGLAGVIVTWNMNLGPHWYPIGLAVGAVPLTLLGGWLRMRGKA
ncbi:hypothetical protein QO010_000918 [Caulobacter ginsengisoli]|uniref:DUF4345 domain-containing protein n=1 Tax=Caulobacter ginsengisoli TaxID=400775 RepID=A0ABU0IP16_9CAUL|nr:hypothetical protein [Caulobacter ginsengisoli]MDQ0463170.1 hypothetical protein [Caulobacter ginsengisoli]